jgi:hypothetical protein
MNVALPLSGWLHLPWRRVAPAKIRRVLFVGAAFAILIYLGTQSGRDLLFGSTGVLQLSGATPRAVRSPARPPESFEMLHMLDPSDDFPQSQVGHLLFTSYNSDMCRRLLFDNRTGALSAAGQIYCGQTPQQSSNQIGQARAQTLLKSFRK